MSNKLELTWCGKEDEIKIEPRLLIENKELSNIWCDPNTENMLIHGDNLLALKALENKYAGKVKCIYIDPPYNIAAADVPYDDNFEHSCWLTLMKARVSLLYTLLSDEGFMFIQIDDEEYAYLKILCDEIFGRKNFISTICLKMSTASGVKTSHRTKTIIKEKEMILCYSKNKDICSFNPQYVPSYEWDSEFQYYLEKNNSINPNDWKVYKLSDILKREKINFDLNSKETKRFLLKNKNNIWRRAFIRNSYKKQSQENPDKILYIQNNSKDHYYYRGREMFFLADKFHNCLTEEGIKYEMSNLVCDFWADINTGKLFNEGNVEFRNSKKPEFLISRIISLTTNEGDLVLDSFLGSGTTIAVATKMKRKWIGIELGNHIYSHCKRRVDDVIANKDNGGMTKAFDWQGGGGYRFYELAPSLVLKDDFDEPVINKDYSPELLASAVALHEGFTFKPDDAVFWKQSVGTENSYLFVTTRHVTQTYLDSIADSMKEDEFLIIACKSYEAGATKAYKNITIKKIPQMLLDKCEFSKDNYNLNIINPPVYDYDEEDDE